VDELEKIIAHSKENFENSDLKKFQDFMLEMQSLGLVKKQDYNIPPIDTLGKKLFESFRICVSAE
jgi:hypothetical protein